MSLVVREDLGIDEATIKRFWSYVDKTDGCWLWTGPLSTDGYGRFKTKGRRYNAHRIAYTWFTGEIPDGLTIDHVCHGTSKNCPGGVICLHRRCVNPAHLEPVPIGVNVRRSPLTVNSRNLLVTHCPRGHEYNGEHLYIHDGKRHCRTCKNERSRLWRRGLKLEDAA